MPGQLNVRIRRGHVNGQWVSSVSATGFAIGGLAGASMKIEDLLKVDCKVGAIPIAKFVLLVITLVWLGYVVLSTGPAFQAFNYLCRVPRKVFIVVTLLFALLWLGMAMWTSAECKETCTQCPKLVLEPDIGVRFLWGIAGSVCTCTGVSGQGQSGITGPPGSPFNDVSVLEWRSVASLDAISQIYSIFHQYGIAVVLIICLVSSAYLSHTEWNTTEQGQNHPVPQPDIIPLGNLGGRGRAVHEQHP